MEIRERLRQYFENEGRLEPYRLMIPKGRYRATFEEVQRDTTTAIVDDPALCLKLFWEPYLQANAQNVILHTEPLFFRDDRSDTYVRNWYVNDRSRAEEELCAHDPETAKRGMSPCFHYLSTGEVYTVLALARLFQQLHAPLDTRNARLSTWNEVRQSNLILLGCTHTNSFMDTLQCGGFTMSANSIEVTDGQGEKCSYRSSRYL